MGRVSVIINCLDCTRYVREAVDSVYSQTFTDWEIAFWDNGSSEYVRGALTGCDDRLRYLRGERAGTVAALWDGSISKYTPGSR